MQERGAAPGAQAAADDTAGTKQASRGNTLLGCGCLGALALAGAVTAVLLMHSGGASNASPAATSTPSGAGDPTPAALSGSAAILAAAGPLRAHIENTNQLICDGDQAYYTADGGGITVYLQGAPNPGDVTVSVLDTEGQGHDQQYTLAAGENGHQFTFADVAPDSVQAVNISESSAGAAGTCQAAER